MQTLIQRIKELANELQIAPEGIRVNCEPLKTWGNEVVQSVELEHNGEVYYIVTYLNVDDVSRELKELNDEFPELEIHI